MSDYRRFSDKSLRLQEWDYSRPGFYFITLVTRHRAPLFGIVKGGQFIGNEFSNILDEFWRRLPDYYNQIRLDEFQIMPDHVHFIVEIIGVEWANHIRLIRLGKLESEQQNSIADSITDSSRKSGPKLNQKQMARRRRMLIPKIVGQYRTQAAKAINLLRNKQGKPVWQPHYTDRIIRNHEELVRIRRYIEENPWRYS